MGALQDQEGGRRVPFPRRARMAVVTVAAATTLLTCTPRGDDRAQLTVATFLGGSAAEALHQELTAIADQLGPSSISLRLFDLAGLRDYLFRTQPHDAAPFDLVVVPNDWLGQLAERSLIGEVPRGQFATVEPRLLRQAVLAVTDRESILGYPISAETLALVYATDLLASPPASLDEIIGAPLPPGVLPLTVAATDPYQLTPMLTCFQPGMLDERGGFRFEPDAVEALFSRLSPLWRLPNTWFVSRQGEVESLELQLFGTGRLAAFITGPWMLDALDAIGKGFAVEPVPPFTGAPYHPRAPVSHVTLAVGKHSRWVDFAHAVAAGLLSEEANERFNRRARRLPVLLECYKTEQAVASAATLGFLRALEAGESLPASASWGEGLEDAQARLSLLTDSPDAPTRQRVRELLRRKP